MPSQCELGKSRGGVDLCLGTSCVELVLLHAPRGLEQRVRAPPHSRSRRAEIEARAAEAAQYGPRRPPRSFRPFKTDEGVRTKPSSYTQRFHARYGDDVTSLAQIARASHEDVAPDVSLRTYRRALQTVFDRGLAAWATGHRPGASQTAWGYARVHSFVLGGKTRQTADADVARRIGAAS
jgi:hypothetical protein